MLEINKLAKIMVKDARKLEGTHNKHYKKRARILKHAIMISKKLNHVIAKMKPLTSPQEIDKMGWQMVEWMTARMEQRTGRKIQVVC